VLGNRYLKSVESVESGTKCQLPNYLIEVYEPRNQPNETKLSSKDALNQTGPRDQKNTDAQKSIWENNASSSRPQVAKTTCSNMDAPQNFNDILRGSATSFLPDLGESISSRNGDPLQFHDVQDGKSGCYNSGIRREVGKSTFGNMDDSLRTASQILSIMKPPSEARISQSSQSGQAHYSLASSEARIALDASCRRNSVINDSNRNFDGSWTSGMSHFATQLRASVKSCLNLQTIPRMNSVRAHQWGKSSRNSHPPHDHQTFMRPAAFEGQDLAMFDIPASDMSNADKEKLDSSSQHTESSSGTESCCNIGTDPGLQEDKGRSANQLSTQNSIADAKCDGPAPTSSYTLTCKDPKIQELVDDCPSFDLGF